MHASPRFVRSSPWLAVLAWGCGSPSAPTPPPPPTPPAVAPTPPSTPEASDPPPATTLPEADVRALVARWENAQNQGDFAAYEALYAPRFRGTKRSFDRVRTYDRAGFLADRRRMFARPMHVTTRDLEVHSTATTAEARFTQAWSSETYSDEGPKRMAIVRGEDGALRISVEEMLASHAPGELEAALSLGAFVAWPTPGGALAVLAEAPESDAAGAPSELAPGSTPMLLVKDAAASAPEPLRALVGREVTLIAPGKTCPGRIARVRTARLVVPHFGARAEWEGQDDGDPATTERRAPPARVAAQAWEMGTRTFYAVAIEGACDDVVGARLGAADSLTALARRDPADTERTALFEAFERTPRFAAHELEYTQFLGGTPSDETPAAPAQRAAWRAESTVSVFEAGERHLGAVLHVSPGCGGFGGATWSAFTLSGAAPSELAADANTPSSVDVLAVFDLDGDGTLEAIARADLGDRVLLRLAPRTAVLRRIPVDFLDCDC